MVRRTRVMALAAAVVVVSACATDRMSAPGETMPPAPGILPQTFGDPVPTSSPAPPRPPAASTPPAPETVVSIVYVAAMAPSADPGASDSPDATTPPLPATTTTPTTPATTTTTTPTTTTTTTTVPPPTDDEQARQALVGLNELPATTTTTTTPTTTTTTTTPTTTTTTTTTTTVPPPTDDEQARQALVGLNELPDGWVELATRADDGVAELYGGLSAALFRWCMGPGNYVVGPELDWQRTGDLGPDERRFPAFRQSVVLADDEAAAQAAFAEVTDERFGECTAVAMASVFDYVIADPAQTTYPAGSELGEIGFERRDPTVGDPIDDAVAWFFRLPLSVAEPEQPLEPGSTTVPGSSPALPPSSGSTPTTSGPPTTQPPTSPPATTGLASDGSPASSTTTTVPEPEPEPELLVELWLVREGRALSTLEFRLVQDVVPSDEDDDFLHTQLIDRGEPDDTDDTDTMPDDTVPGDAVPDGTVPGDTDEPGDDWSLIDLVAQRLAAIAAD